MVTKLLSDREFKQLVQRGLRLIAEHPNVEAFEICISPQKVEVRARPKGRS